MKDRIHTIADLLLGAAHSDEEFHGKEKAEVKHLLKQILEASALPMDLEFHIEEFDPSKLDVKAAGGVFAADPPEVKRRMLELIAAIHGADEEFDMAEDAYLHQVGEAMGLHHAAYEDLIVSVVEEVDLVEDLQSVRFIESESTATVVPPPPPGKTPA